MNDSIEELAFAIALAETEGLGPVGMVRLANTYGSAALAWRAPVEDWKARTVTPVPEEKRLAPDSEKVQKRIAEIERSGGWALSVFDAAYPPLLHSIYDPPPILYGRGNSKALEGVAVAVVGSRRATRYGLEHAHRLATGLGREGITLVSGLAVGVDAVAHRAALEVGALTVAVLGSGTRRVYPALHEGLADELVKTGALVSEVAPFVPADRTNFPRRNRIISGLSRAVVILEARKDSGSLITGREALDQGREIFVVPGPAGGANRGGHRFLADGASFAEGPEDILSFLGRSSRKEDAPSGTSRQAVAVPVQWRPVWDAIGPGSRHIDDLIIETGLRSGDVLGILLQMELHGLVQQQPGKNFVRVA